MQAADQPLIGIGLYTPAEAGRLIGVTAAKLSRWLRGHTTAGRWYPALWEPEIDLGDQKAFLSFRDLMEARMAALFIAKGLSPQKVRAAIQLARGMVGDRPLSTTWLRTDGRTVFLRVLEADGAEPRLLDLFQQQWAFNAVVERSFKDVEFVGALPRLWWPAGRQSGIVVDPARAFGQPIEHSTSVPARVLADAAVAEGSVKKASSAWAVPAAAIRRAIAFQREFDHQRAA